MRREVHRASVTDSTKATQGRATLDLGLPKARSAYYTDGRTSISEGECTTPIHRHKKSLHCLKELIRGLIETIGSHRPKTYTCISSKGL